MELAPNDMTGRLIAAGRGYLGWSRQKLAARAEVDHDTVRNAEHGRPITDLTNIKLRKALRAAGVEITEMGISVSRGTPGADHG